MHRARDEDAEYGSLVCPVSAGHARDLARVLDPLTAETSLRDLLYVTVSRDGAERLCRLSAVLDVDGNLVAHTFTRATDEGPVLSNPEGLPSERDAGADSLVPLATIPGLEAVVQALEPALMSAAVPALAADLGVPVAAVTGMEFHVDRGGAAALTLFTDPHRPPLESGAAHHLWHAAPDLDDLKEALAPLPWHQRAMEAVRTWVGRVFAGR